MLRVRLVRYVVDKLPIADRIIRCGNSHTLTTLESTMRLIALPAVVLSLSLLIPHASAQEKQPTYILIQNVRIFDGVNDKLTPGHVLIENNLIKQVGAIQTAPKGTKVIDGGGRTLMPGLMDAHVHLALVRRPKEIRNDYDWMYVGALAGDQAKKMLLRGFTTVRDNFPEQSKEFLTLAEHFSNVEVLRMATSNVADLLKLSGKLNPYQDGQLGVVKEGAYADLLLVDGNPLDDVTILAEYEKNIQLIMKDGKVYKNTLN